VTQVNGDGGNDIWVSYFSPEGSFGWYPTGGDFGYTSIARTGGVDFESVGFLRGSGYTDTPVLGLYYELFDNGSLVLAGTVAHNGFLAGSYLGWSGGGFDEIRLRDSLLVGVDSLSGYGLNALAVDAIELSGGRVADPTPVPEPATLLLVGTGIAAVARRRLKGRAR
jgi:hypothetical protein